MKKQILILSIILMILTICFCGCNEEKDSTDDDLEGETNGENEEETTVDPSKFYGSWLEESENEGTIMTMRHTYASDGTYTFEILDREHSDTGTWVLEGGNLTTTTSRVTIYTYSFSEDYTVLTLTDVTTMDVSVLTKQ